MSLYSSVRIRCIPIILDSQVGKKVLCYMASTNFNLTSPYPPPSLPPLPYPPLSLTPPPPPPPLCMYYSAVV